jgi:hypothetical protein
MVALCCFHSIAADDYGHTICCSTCCICMHQADAHISAGVVKQWLSVCRFQHKYKAMVRVYPQGRGCQYPRFCTSRYCADTIRELGTVMATTSAYGESTHKESKASYAFTYMYHDSFTENVAHACFRLHCSQALFTVSACRSTLAFTSLMYFVASLLTGRLCMRRCCDTRLLQHSELMSLARVGAGQAEHTESAARSAITAVSQPCCSHWVSSRPPTQHVLSALADT